MVKAGMGISVMARWAVEPHLSAARLVARPLARGGFFRQWCAVTRNSKTQPPWVAHFVEGLTTGLAPSRRVPVGGGVPVYDD